MKKCVPRMSDRIIAVIAAAVCAIIAFFAFREWLYGEQSHIVFCAAGVLCAGISIHTLCRMIYMGDWGFFYNDEKIIFVLSRKDRREFRWDELQDAKADIFYPSSPAAWYFYFRDQKKIKKIAVTPRMTGYDEFVGMLRKKGFPAQNPGTISFDSFDKETASEIFREVFGEDFGKGGGNRDR